MAELAVIGVNHRTAPVEVRERLALTPEALRRLLDALHAEPVFDEAVVISTCNRTECCFVPRRPADHVRYLLDHVAAVTGAAPVDDTSVFYRHDGAAAVRHVFRVAASLDSQIVGEHQILGQVRTAYKAAVEARTAGFLMNKLLHRAFRVGKRVQTETDLGRGSAGVAPAAVELAGQIFQTLRGKTVLLVGAGETAEAAARTLLKCGAARLIVANRTLYRAQQLAWDLVHEPPPPEQRGEIEGAACPGGEADAGEESPPTCPALSARAAEEPSLDMSAELAALEGPPGRIEARTEGVGLEDLPRVVPLADLVISSTGATEPVLTAAALAQALRRRGSPILMIDIAVPRDVDPRLADLDNVYLYNIDDLDRLVERNLARRRQEIPRAEAIVEFEIIEFNRWLASRQVAPTIRRLQRYLATARQAQIERYGKQFSEADRVQLEQFTQGLCSQIIHKPMAMLKALSEDGSPGDRLAAVDMICRMFDLDSMEDDASV
jgi:glutamyl-tRNA reductase